MSDALPYIRTPLALPEADNFRAYNFDKLGNWVNTGLTEGDPAVLYSRDWGDEKEEHRTTNNLNQAITGTKYAYDSKGNLLTNGNLTLTYDAFNRLIAASGDGPDGQSFDASYGYDALNRRVFKQVIKGESTTSTRYLLDGEQVIEERNGAGTILRQYVWGQYVDELVQQREYEKAPEGREYVDWYPLSDLLYRTVALTDDRICDAERSERAILESKFSTCFRRGDNAESFLTIVYGNIRKRQMSRYSIRRNINKLRDLGSPKGRIVGERLSPERYDHRFINVLNESFEFIVHQISPSTP